MKRRRMEKFNLRSEAEICDRKLRPRKLNPRWLHSLMPTTTNVKPAPRKTIAPTSGGTTGEKEVSPLRRSSRRRFVSQRLMDSSLTESIPSIAAKGTHNVPAGVTTPSSTDFPATPCRSMSSESESTSPLLTTPVASSTSFTSCLLCSSPSPITTIPASPRSSITLLLTRAVSVDVLADDSWLSSSLVDLVFAKFARCYTSTTYLSIDFAALTTTTSPITDILGRPLCPLRLVQPIVFLCNSSNRHWTLLRVLPSYELQLFEPLGKPLTRNGSLSLRYIPRNIVQWLDSCYPLDDGRSWLAVTTSAITTQHQVTSFDCGVACLLYAEKCGQGQDKFTINSSTSQQDITDYRKTLQMFVQSIKSV